MIERVSHKGVLIAVLIRNDFEGSGVNFVSEPDFPLQVAVSFYEKGKIIKPHVHMPRNIEISQVQEVVFMQSGKARITLYSEVGEKFKVLDVNGGDIIFFVSGGHGIEMLEDTKLSEVKQGPYAGKENDKKMLE